VQSKRLQGDQLQSKVLRIVCKTLRQIRDEFCMSGPNDLHMYVHVQRFTVLDLE